MKIDFKKAAQAVKKHVKGSTLMFALAAGGLAYGGVKAVDYYSASPEKTAYTQCIDEKKPCTPEQMALVEKHIKDSNTTTLWMIMPQMWFLLGLGARKDEKHSAKVREIRADVGVQMDKYYEELGRRLELAGKLEQAEAKLAPYLADDKRKADDAAATAAKQQLNQMAQDATTLQGQIKVGKKISIKQTPPSQS
jgi:hypothetical protein